MIRRPAYAAALPLALAVAACGPEPRTPTPAGAVLAAEGAALRFGARPADGALNADLALLFGACERHLAGRPVDAAALARAGYAAGPAPGRFAKARLAAPGRVEIRLTRACTLSATAPDPAPLAFRAAIAESLAAAGYTAAGSRPGIVDPEDREAGHDYWTGPLGTLSLRFLDRVAAGGVSSEVTIERQ